MGFPASADIVSPQPRLVVNLKTAKALRGTIRRAGQVIEERLEFAPDLGSTQTKS
jgi:hypothetical protein